MDRMRRWTEQRGREDEKMRGSTLEGHEGQVVGELVNCAPCRRFWICTEFKRSIANGERKRHCFSDMQLPLVADKMQSLLDRAHVPKEATVSELRGMHTPRVQYCSACAVSHWLEHASHWLEHASHWLEHVSHWRVHVSHWRVHVSHWLEHVSHWLEHASHWLEHVSHWRVHVSHWLEHASHWRVCVFPLARTHMCCGSASFAAKEIQSPDGISSSNQVT